MKERALRGGDWKRIREMQNKTKVEKETKMAEFPEAW